jgi:predicted regulator of Ras-like GTPase activity (Roadblock/LC7/MglB family)
MTVTPQLIQAAELGADRLMQNIKGAKALAIATEDGFEIVGRVENNATASRLAAMASSLAALGALAGEESELGACDNVTIEAAEGYICMVQVQRENLGLILSVVTGRDAIIGQIIFMTKQVAKSLRCA